ncbi:MAG TPA: SDR family NAD(P)-dependent oxidoreductase, partial [Acidimicrobiia bacterium]|nr:SDR family NAD(P)-dependent oxidoreductase [Acidimicrobiia bacterium]
ATVGRIGAAGGEAVAVGGNVARPADVQQMVAAAETHFGPVDILACIAGVLRTTSGAEKISEDEWDLVLDVNLKGMFLVTQTVAPAIARSGGGSIVNMSTIEAHRAMPDMGVYGAMKAAVAHLTMTLAVELGPHGIRVNAIAPDLFPNETTAAAGFGAGDADSPLTDVGYQIAVPLGRTGEEHEVAGPVLFLASDLSSYITGTTVHIDGGTLATGGWLHWPEGYRNTIPHSVLEHLER